MTTYTRADLMRIEFATRDPSAVAVVSSVADLAWRNAVCGECGETMGGNEHCPMGCEHPANAVIMRCLEGGKRNATQTTNAVGKRGEI